ncbi:cytochrome b [Thetidibacter halocola]|uniref:Cytochrome b/b6 domain-containing protein n=1 Tax=Thetidibacter halocola TaxID=2827239 RepID=A0A8J7WFZ2_9RHOB|nr:cytochrome b/b6 domain-containing protein [Thetidibacter halocola]MBS0125669.1 cytochrome b/b6 domain-containing protein [Thetidibacter halocola]
MRQPSGYSATQIGLHWVVAVLVAAQFVLHDGISSAWDAYTKGQDVAFSPVVFAHVAGGVLILALVLWRLALRLSRGAPPPPENEPAPLKTLSHVAHWGFYGLMAGMTLTGGLAWFGGVAQAAQAHNVLKVALLALIVLHVLAVPFHRVVLKNNVMLRMIRPGA